MDASALLAADMKRDKGSFDVRLAAAGANLSKEQLKQVAEKFRLVDRDKDGRLTPQECGILFRAFGQNPTDDELTEMTRTMPSQGLELDGFAVFFSTHYKTPTSEEQLISAFQTFDLDDSGFINSARFKDMLAALGQPLPTEEVDAILREANMDERGIFNYKALARKLCDGPMP